VNNNWANINEDLVYKKIICCTNVNRIKLLGKYLFKVKCKLENKVRGDLNPRLLQWKKNQGRFRYVGSDHSLVRMPYILGRNTRCSLKTRMTAFQALIGCGAPTRTLVLHSHESYESRSGKPTSRL
jgi:hypothetical protein